MGRLPDYLYLFPCSTHTVLCCEEVGTGITIRKQCSKTFCKALNTMRDNSGSAINRINSDSNSDSSREKNPTYGNAHIIV